MCNCYCRIIVELCVFAAFLILIIKNSKIQSHEIRIPSCIGFDINIQKVNCLCFGRLNLKDHFLLMLLSIGNIESYRSHHQYNSQNIRFSTTYTSVNEKKYDANNKDLKIYLKVPSPIHAHLFSVIHKLLIKRIYLHILLQCIILAYW